MRQCPNCANLSLGADGRCVHCGAWYQVPAAPKRIGDLCKECGQATFVYEEGCKKCLSCGFNEC